VAPAVGLDEAIAGALRAGVDAEDDHAARPAPSSLGAATPGSRPA
jgi:hypothetical protein